MRTWDPGPLADAAADALTAAAVLVAVLVWLTTRAWKPTMPILLELLLAAGLLRLGASDSWHAIAGAGVIVAIRTLVTSGTRPATTRTAPAPSAGSGRRRRT